MSTGNYRLLTRSDFDGLVCAVLLKDVGMIDSIKFVHPKDVQDGKIDIGDHDILTNLPYVDSCHLCFDHHDSEEIRTEGVEAENYILDSKADSAAGVVFKHYGGAERFTTINPEMIEAVDRADSARFNRHDVLDPDGWTLLSFLMDARTGLGRFRDFRISNYDLMMELIEYCKEHTIEEILALPDVSERVDLYRDHEERMKEQLLRCSTVHDNVVVLDLRDEETIYAGNRFMIYALFPACDVSMHVIWGLKKQNTVFAMGKSIFDRSCPVDIGELALEYEGGGHTAAGTCQIANENAERVQKELIARLTSSSSSAAGDAPPSDMTRAA